MYSNASSSEKTMGGHDACFVVRSAGTHVGQLLALGYVDDKVVVVGMFAYYLSGIHLLLGEDEELIREVTLLDLELPDLRGAIRRLTDLKGKVVLLDFTVYKNQESPARNIAMRELYDKYAAQGLEVYQVSFDTDEHFWKTSADNLPWICVRDAEGGSALTYRVENLHTYFLIDRANGLYKRSSDIKDNAQLKQEIEKLLKMK